MNGSASACTPPSHPPRLTTHHNPHLSTQMALQRRHNERGFRASWCVCAQLSAPNSTSPSIRSAAALYSGAALMQCEHHGAYMFTTPAPKPTASPQKTAAKSNERGMGRTVERLAAGGERAHFVVPVLVCESRHVLLSLVEILRRLLPARLEVSLDHSHATAIRTRRRAPDRSPRHFAAACTQAANGRTGLTEWRRT